MTSNFINRFFEPIRKEKLFEKVFPNSQSYIYYNSRIVKQLNSASVSCFGASKTKFINININPQGNIMDKMNKNIHTQIGYESLCQRSMRMNFLDEVYEKDSIKNKTAS